jgi:hypothetical protein
MKKSSTLFLKIAVFIIALLALGGCFLMYAVIFGDAADEGIHTTLFEHPLLVAVYATVIPFMIALVHAFKILRYIDQRKAFSDLSIKALKNIKICAYTISGIYFVSLPFFLRLAEAEDAPGVVIMGLVLVGAAIVVAVFAALLQKLLRNAIEMKNENELTV